MDIRKLTKQVTFKQLWIRDQFEKIRLAVPAEVISNEDLLKKLAAIYETRHVSEGRFFNNLSNENMIMTQEGFINRFLNCPYVLSGYAALFENQDNVKSVSSDALNDLRTSRKKFKKMMGQAEYGSDEYVYYKVMQLTFKLLANSYYGILGEKNSIFYNPFVQNSITITPKERNYET